MIGCGFMFTGLICGALSGSIEILGIFLGIGVICLSIQQIIKKSKEPKRSVEYPPYGY